MRTRSQARAGLALVVGLALTGGTLVFAVLFGAQIIGLPPDAVTYLAAGERLNAGHRLYELAPGDRPVPLVPPYWTVPLLSPPLIAVLWRPLALLGEPSVWVWMAGSFLGLALAVGAVAHRAPLATGVLTVALAVPLADQARFGNVNVLLACGGIATWWLSIRRRNRWAGALIGVMAAVKLWPLLLALPLAAHGDWRSVVAGVVIGAGACLILSIVGAGWEAHLEYVDIALSIQPSIGSPAAYLHNAGIDAPWISYVILAFGVALVAVFRRRRGLAFGIGVVTMVFGAPIVHIGTLVILLACLAPVAWPANPRQTVPDLPVRAGAK